jgi:demethylspheroidene O-methyltransferase
MIATRDAKACSSCGGIAPSENTIDLYTVNVQSFGHMRDHRIIHEALPSARPPSGRPPEWLRRWITLRNRILGSRSFQEWASRLPFFAMISRQRAASAFDLVAGFVYSQVLHAAVETDLLDLLHDGPVDAPMLTARTGLSTDAALRLLRAAAAIDLAEEVGPGCWMLGQQGAAIRSNPGALAMVRHHALLYADLADPVALLRMDRQEPTALSRFWHYSTETDGETSSRYSELMAASQQMVAQQALAAYPFDRHRRLLDVGGGHGAFVSAIAAACPSLELGVFDLPPVLAGARGLPSRVALHPGDFFASPLPEGYDCVTLSRILHDHDDDRCLRILRTVRAALPEGGRLVIAEPMAGIRGAEGMGDAYFGLYLWAMNSGRPRTPAEYGTLLDTAGFARWQQRGTNMPVITSLIVSSC